MQTVYAWSPRPGVRVAGRVEICGWMLGCYRSDQSSKNTAIAVRGQHVTTMHRADVQGAENGGEMEELSTHCKRQEESWEVLRDERRSSLLSRTARACLCHRRHDSRTAGRQTTAERRTKGEHFRCCSPTSSHPGCRPHTNSHKLASLMSSRRSLACDRVSPSPSSSCSLSPLPPPFRPLPPPASSARDTLGQTSSRSLRGAIADALAIRTSNTSRIIERTQPQDLPVNFRRWGTQKDSPRCVGKRRAPLLHSHPLPFPRPQRSAPHAFCVQRLHGCGRPRRFGAWTGSGAREERSSADHGPRAPLRSPRSAANAERRPTSSGRSTRVVVPGGRAGAILGSCSRGWRVQGGVKSRAHSDRRGVRRRLLSFLSLLARAAGEPDEFD